MRGHRKDWTWLSGLLARNGALHPGVETMRHEREALRLQYKRGAIIC